MIHQYISHNGRVMPVTEARLSPGQEAVINGSGLFTTMRIFQGRPFAFDRHLRRLRRDSERTHIPFPFQDDELLAEVNALIAKNEVQEGALRVYVLWNRTGIWHSDENFPEVDLILTVAPLPSFREPVRLDLREHGRHAASPLAGVKVTSWLNNVWNASEAKRRGFDEVVLLNERGEVAECTAANVFVVRGGAVRTPPLSSGCLAGVTRELLLEIGPKAGVPVTEAVLRPEDLFAADEVFISSTNRALLAVGEIAGHKIQTAPGPITMNLAQVFVEHIKEYQAARRPKSERRHVSA